MIAVVNRRLSPWEISGRDQFGLRFHPQPFSQPVQITPIHAKGLGTGRPVHLIFLQRSGDELPLEMLCGLLKTWCDTGRGFHLCVAIFFSRARWLEIE